MGFVIAILITLAMAGSVMWVMPSPREKRLSELRMRALKRGLKVRLLDKNMAAALYPWLDNYRPYVSYELPFPAGKSIKLDRAVVVRMRVDANVHELDLLDPLRVNLVEQGMFELFPNTAEALVFYSGGVSVLWTELGDVSEVDRVREGLGACIDLNAGVIHASVQNA